MSKRPTTVKIGPCNWPITYVKQIGNNEAGITYQLEHRIEICSNMPEDGIKATLIHEILHAIAWTYGFHLPNRNQEEAAVSLFAVPLLTFLRENTKIVQYLSE